MTTLAATDAAAAERALALPARMLRFVKERFPLEVHGVSILVFFVTGSAVAQVATTRHAGAGPIAFGARSVAIALVVGLMFLRLRLFDEVKDLSHDLVHNPRRPLPRGLLTARQVNAWAVATAAIEGALAALLGPGALAGYAVVLAFSLLMRFEFFCRDLIRPRLFTYALIHTPSGGLIGLFVFGAVTGIPFWHAPRPVWFYAASGWTLLMVFELARKTFDPKTEPGPDTYSSVFGPRGAALMNGAFTLATTLLIVFCELDALGSGALEFPMRQLTMLLWGLTAVVLSIIAGYYLAPSRSSAARLRLAVQGYLVLSSVLLAAELVAARGLAIRAGA